MARIAGVDLSGKAFAHTASASKDPSSSSSARVASASSPAARWSCLTQRVFYDRPANASLHNTLQRPTRKLHVSRHGNSVKVPRAVQRPPQHRPVQRLEQVPAAFKGDLVAWETVDGGEESEVFEVRFGERLLCCRDRDEQTAFLLGTCQGVCI